MSHILLIKLFAVYLVVSCGGPGIRYDIEKQHAFKDKFSIGMSRFEVETVMDGLEGITISEEQILENGEILVVYYTNVTDGHRV